VSFVVWRVVRYTVPFWFRALWMNCVAIGRVGHHVSATLPVASRGPRVASDSEDLK
jgi:hypothetical protein